MLYYRIKRSDGLYYGLEFRHCVRALAPVFTSTSNALPIGTKSVAKAHVCFLRGLGYTVRVVKVTAKPKNTTCDPLRQTRMLQAAAKAMENGPVIVVGLDLRHTLLLRQMYNDLNLPKTIGNNRVIFIFKSQLDKLHHYVDSFTPYKTLMHKVFIGR